MPYQQIDLSGLKTRLSESQINLAESSFANPIDNTILEVTTAPMSPFLLGSKRKTSMSFSPRLASVLGVFGILVLTVGLAINLPNGSSSAAEEDTTGVTYKAIEVLKAENGTLKSENLELQQKYRELQQKSSPEAVVSRTEEDKVIVTEVKEVEDKVEKVTAEVEVPALSR